MPSRSLCRIACKAQVYCTIFIYKNTQSKNFTKIQNFNYVFAYLKNEKKKHKLLKKTAAKLQLQCITQASGAFIVSPDVMHKSAVEFSFSETPNLQILGKFKILNKFLFI